MYRTYASPRIIYHIRALKHISSSLSTDMAKTVASALVNSRLDYANSVLYKFSDYVETIAISELTCSCSYIHETCQAYSPCTSSIALFPINYRINYKVATLAYKVRSTGSPAYLLPSFNDYVSNLWSSSQNLLNVPVVRTQIARRAFSHAAPSLWNDLSVDIRRSESFGHFRTEIRALYFRSDCWA